MSASGSVMSVFGYFVFINPDASECSFGTVLYAFHAMNALRAVFPVPRIVRDIDVHRTYPFAFPARDTFLLIASYPQKREITHGFQKHRDRTDIFAESPIILKGKCEDDPHRIIQNVADDKRPKHDSFNIPDVCQKQCGNKTQ